MAAVVVIILFLWVGSLIMNPLVFPGPVGVAEGISSILSNNLDAIAITFRRFLLAFAAAVLCGWAVGLLMGAFRSTFGRLMRPIVSTVQAVPALSWILVIILWTSVVEVRITFVTFAIAFPFFVIAVYEGIRDMDKDVLEAIEQFRPTRLQVLRKLLMPQSLVSLIMTMRTTAAMTLKIMVFAELLAASTGVGKELSLAQSNFRIDLIFAWTIILILANFVLIRVVDLIEKFALKWRTEAVVR